MIRTYAPELRTFEEVFNSLFGPTNRQVERTALHIPIDVIEKPEALTVIAALPGVAENDVKITVEENVLTIAGESQSHSVSENDKVYRQEVTRGRFSRSIRLPEGLNLDNVTAQYENGVVTLNLPKAELPQPKVRTIGFSQKPTEPAEVQ